MFLLLCFVCLVWVVFVLDVDLVPGRRIMSNTNCSVLAPFFRLRDEEHDTSLYDDDPRLKSDVFRLKQQQVL